MRNDKKQKNSQHHQKRAHGLLLWSRLDTHSRLTAHVLCVCVCVCVCVCINVCVCVNVCVWKRTGNNIVRREKKVTDQSVEYFFTHKIKSEEWHAKVNLRVEAKLLGKCVYEWEFNGK